MTRPVAEIVEACREICDDAELCHGKISICFTPDEEIGRGADKFDFETFDADFAYTVDGGELGGIEYENFNAAGAKITFNGVNTHPGSAKNKMKNAVLYLAEFINMLPAAEAPAHTENREGFYHVSSVNGNESKATLHMIIRDHNKQSFAKRKEFITVLVEFFNRKYGENTVSAEIKDSYYNMLDVIKEHIDIVERAKKAMRKAGVEPQITPIRGGTDGARLSFEGLPCPNLSTGGMNFHSIYEAIPVNAMLKMVEVIKNLVSE
jgi:tripeptide aminopeptidase